MNDQTVSRFLAKVEKGDSCWLWKGKIHKRTGYGGASVDCRDILAHRLSWLIHGGEIPDGQCVLHRCDVRACVNPAHLWVGTRAQNSADMVAKGRQATGLRTGRYTKPERTARGSRNGQAKLTEADVVEIKRMLRDGLGICQIAPKFGVNSGAIWFIQHGRSWKHVLA